VIFGVKVAYGSKELGSLKLHMKYNILYIFLMITLFQAILDMEKFLNMCSKDKNGITNDIKIYEKYKKRKENSYISNDVGMVIDTHEIVH
jgi:hypothetical protein